MPTTSSPWASPSSPAGRRLLQSEPATADDIPVLDDRAFALGAALVAATDAAQPAAPRTRGRGPCPRRPRRRTLGRGLPAVVLLVGLVAGVAATGDERATPAAPIAASGPVQPFALGRAAGAAMGAEALPVAGGEVVVGLIEPTEALRAEAAGAPAGPGAREVASLARRLGTLTVLAADEPTAG